MTTTFLISHVFKTNYKWYSQKFRSLEDDIKKFKNDISKLPSVDLGGGVFKYRLLVKSKNTGQSGGFRVVTLEVLITKDQKNITMLTIYDKSEQESISKKEIEAIIKSLG